NEVLLRQDGVDDLRNDRIFIADDAGKDGLPCLEPFDQIFAKLVLNGTPGDAHFREFLVGAEFAEGLRQAPSGHFFLQVWRCGAGSGARPQCTSMNLATRVDEARGSCDSERLNAWISTNEWLSRLSVLLKLHHMTVLSRGSRRVRARA